MTTETKARAACNEAMRLAFGDRLDSYGDPKDSFQRISHLWWAYTGFEFTTQQVAVMLLLMKISRSRTDNKPDTWHDMVAYAALGAALR